MISGISAKINNSVSFKKRKLHEKSKKLGLKTNERLTLPDGTSYYKNNDGSIDCFQKSGFRAMRYNPDGSYTEYHPDGSQDLHNDSNLYTHINQDGSKESVPIKRLEYGFHDFGTI